jgi:hypothetical protein
MKMEMSVNEFIEFASRGAVGLPMSRESIKRLNKMFGSAGDALAEARIAVALNCGEREKIPVIRKQAAAENMVLEKLAKLKDLVDQEKGHKNLTLIFN